MTLTNPTAFGRKYPKNDWEGDDFTPGAGGHYVTCVDTSCGRAISWATNGRIDLDGSVIRSHVTPPDPNGITFEQAKPAIKAVSGLDLIIPAAWGKAKTAAHLTAGKGLCVIGNYAALSPIYRSQAGNADFRHCIWFSHISATSGVRMWDALTTNAGWGRWIPEADFWAFVTSGSYRLAYVPLQQL